MTDWESIAAREEKKSELLQERIAVLHDAVNQILYICEQKGSDATYDWASDIADICAKAKGYSTAAAIRR